MHGLDGECLVGIPDNNAKAIREVVGPEGLEPPTRPL